eukprot:gene14156-biopygen3574
MAEIGIYLYLARPRPPSLGPSQGGETPLRPQKKNKVSSSCMYLQGLSSGTRPQTLIPGQCAPRVPPHGAHAPSPPKQASCDGAVCDSVQVQPARPIEERAPYP